MTAVKERIMGVITLMNDQEAQAVWDMLQSRFVVAFKEVRDWTDVEEVEPDETDMAMLAEIESDPDCHEFVITHEELLKELGI